ncbi:MAG: SDR family NAD(P)-dependent oxidoreductase [Deltaproteobacteria bacterium]|jgi:NAD(P)-dependent dehydrogenase (short-subunit alcohol dehydrogenase family)|nr:SDR family NAD(P)-dependent oxidoreductase [Deltaproteobacteria bacterium]MBW2530130.1 SDR family NAD(P)-dependent oxidoreductase [Deltaproteobacteria bacterium]
MRDLHDKVVVVTGAGSGIGRATARAFAAAGARLHLVDVDESRVRTVAAEVGHGGAGREPVAHVVDCGDAGAMRQLAEGIYAADGRVDVLHNNAGVCVGGPVQDLALDDWRWIFDVNVWGVIHGIHFFVPRMIAQGGGGHVVNTASMAGLVGLPMVAPYCASKFAVVGLSEALAAELAAHRIRVTVVCPGAVRTNVMRDGRLRLPGAWGERIRKAFDRHSASPEDLAAAIVEAVERDRSLVLWPGHMWPLWLLKRTSIPLYHRTARRLTAWALGGR